MALRSRKTQAAETPRKRSPLTRLFLWLLRVYLKSWLVVFLVLVTVVLLFKWVNPPTTYLMITEAKRLGTVAYVWRDIEDMSANVPLAVAAAEDANFCAHDGFDFDAIRAAMSDGSGRGGSTISQQVVKNLFLWPGRSWLRKGLETGLTVMIESLWSKRRIMEVYLNIAEFGKGVFGIDAAVQKYYGRQPENLLPSDAARLALVLPSPRTRVPTNLPRSLVRRVSRISIGASTLRAEERADCFLPKPSP